MKKNMFSSCCSAADRTALRLYGSAAERSSPQEHNHAMEEGQKHRNMTILPFYSPLPESETLLHTAKYFRKETGITVDCIHLPCRRNDCAARAEARTTREASVLLGGSADNYIFSCERPVCWRRIKVPGWPMCPKPIRMSRACGIRSTSALATSPATPTGLHGQERRCRPAGTTICCRLHWQGRL